MSLDILEEVEPEDVPTLLETFKQDLTNHYPLSQYIQIMEDYKRAEITNPVESLYRYGNIKRGVYLFKAHFTLGDIPHTIFHVYTASDDYSDLEKALSGTSRIAWNTRSYVFQFTMARFAPVVRKVASDKGVQLDWVQGDSLWLPPEAAVDDREVPDNMNLKFLNESHAELIDKEWSFRFPESVKYLQIQITNNFGFGLFTKDENKMVCCGVAYNSGGIFCLFTDPQFRGKGYAELVVRKMVIELRLRGQIPFATVDEKNIPSQKIFRKLGFKELSKMQFLSPPNHYNK